jgi:hypothetical protein
LHELVVIVLRALTVRSTFAIVRVCLGQVGLGLLGSFDLVHEFEHGSILEPRLELSKGWTVQLLFCQQLRRGFVFVPLRSGLAMPRLLALGGSLEHHLLHRDQMFDHLGHGFAN